MAYKPNSKLTKIVAGIGLTFGYVASAYADPFTLIAVAVAAAVPAAYAGAVLAAGAILSTMNAKRKAQRAAANANAAYNANLTARNQIYLQEEMPLQTIVGEPGPVGGAPIAAFTSGDKDQYRHVVVVYANHPCQEFLGVFLDGESIGTISPTTGNTIDGKFYKGGKPQYWLERVNFDANGVCVIPGVEFEGKLEVSVVLQAGDPLDIDSETGARVGVVEKLYPATYVNNLSNGTSTVTAPDAKGKSGVRVIGRTYTAGAGTSDINVRVHINGDGIPDAMLREKFPAEWTENHRLRNQTYIVYTLDLNNTKFQGGMPNLTASFKGKNDILDPRTGQRGYTRNNALIHADFLKNPYTYNAADDDFDLPSLIAAANACDAAIYDPAGEGNGGSAARYTCDGVYRSDEPRDTTRKNLENSMAGSSFESGGVWTVRAGVWSASTATIDNNAMLAPVEVIQSANSSKERWNSKRARFIDKNKGGSSEESTPYQNPALLALDNNIPRWTDESYPFTSSLNRTRQLARISVERSRGGLIINVTPRMIYWRLQPGDRVRIEDARLGISGTFKMQEWNYVHGSPLSLILEEDVEAFYDNVDLTEADPSPNTNLPDAFTVPIPPQNFVAESGPQWMLADGNTAITRVRLSWAQSTSVYVTQGGLVELGWKLVSQADSAWIGSTLPGASTEEFLIAPPVGRVISARIRFLTTLGVPSEWVYYTHAVEGVPGQLDPVTGLSVDTTKNDGIHVTWAAPQGLDAIGWDVTEVRLGASWDTGTVRFTGHATTANIGWLPAGTLLLWVASRRTNGEWSVPQSVGVNILAPLTPVIGATREQSEAIFEWADSRTTQPILAYRIWIGPNQNALVDVATQTATRFSRQHKLAGQHRYWFQAIDMGGNASGLTNAVIETLPSIEQTIEEQREGLDDLAQQIVDLGTGSDADYLELNTKIANEQAARLAAAVIAANKVTQDIAAEAALRVAADQVNATAIAKETTDRGTAITAAAVATATNLAAAVAVETAARNAALQAQAQQTAADLASATLATNDKIAKEIVLRQNDYDLLTKADAAFASLSGLAVANEAEVRIANITEEREARITADAAEATARLALTTQYNNLQAALTEEQSTRATADTAQATARQTLATRILGTPDPTGTTLPTLTSGLLYEERTARSTADSAMSTRVDALTSTVTTNNTNATSAITNEATTRATADTALGTRIDLITASVGDNLSQALAAVQSEATARATADTALGTRIDSVVATANTDRTNTSAAFTAEQTARADAISAQTTARQALSAKLLGVTDPTGVTLPSLTSGIIFDERTVRATADTAATTRMDGMVSTMNTDRSNALAGLTEEASTRATADTAQVTARQALSTKLTGMVDPASATLGTLSSGLIFDERTTRATADTNLNTLITNLTSTVNTNKSNIEASLNSEITTRANADTAEVTARQALSSRMTGLVDPANATLGTLTSGLLYDERTTRSTADTALATDISNLSASVTSNNATLMAAIQAEATARANAVSAEAGTRTTLVAQINDRAASDADLGRLADTLFGDIAALGISNEADIRFAAIVEERDARVTADAAEAAARLLLTTQFNNVSAALADEVTARSTADTAQVTARQALSTKLTGMVDPASATLGNLSAGLIFEERSARATADTNLNTLITNLTSTVNTNKTNIEAALNTAQTTLANATTAEVTARQALSTKLTGMVDPATATLGTLSAGLIFDERTTRATADTNLNTLITSLTSTVNTNKANIEASLSDEVTTRATADTAQVTARQALSTKLTGLADPASATLASLSSGLIYDERTTRATADTNLNTLITSLTSTVNTNKTNIEASLADEVTTRATADTAQVTARQALSTKVTGLADPTNATLASLSAGLIFEERTTRATADTNINTLITNLTSTVNTNKTNIEASLADEVTTRATADTAQVTARQALSTKITGLADPTNATLANLSAGLIYDERTTRATADTNLNTLITNLTSTVNTNKTNIEASLADEVTTRATADTAQVTARQALSTKVTGLADPTNATLGTLSAGLIYDERTTRATADTNLNTLITNLTSTVSTNKTNIEASLADEVTTRATADTAQVTARQALSTKLTGMVDPASATLGTLSSGLIYDERTTRATADTNLNTLITNLTSTVNTNKSNIEASLNGEITTRANADTAEVTARQALSSKVTGLADPASATLGSLTSGLLYDERTTRSTADTAMATDISNLSAAVTSNNSTLMAAIQAEATARANAVSAEAGTRTTLVAQINDRATSDSEVGRLADTLFADIAAMGVANEADIRAAAIVEERDARVTADAAEATARLALTTQFNNVQAALNDEVTARSTADTAQVTARQALSTKLTGMVDPASATLGTLSSGLIFDERTTRATADTNLNTLITNLTSTVNTNKTNIESALNTAQTTLANATTAEVTARQSLSTKLTGLADPASATLASLTTGLIFDERTTRTTADTNLNTLITNLTSTVNTNKTNIESALSTAQTTLANATTAEVTARQALSTKLTGVNDPASTTLANLSAGLVFEERTARATADTNLNTLITNLTSTVNTNKTNAESAMTTEQTTRANADTAEATARQALSSKVTGLADPTNATLGTLSAGLIYDERTTRATADTNLNTLITNLTSTVNTNKLNIEASLNEEATTRASADSALVTSTTTLKAKLDRLVNYRIVAAGMSSSQASGTNPGVFGENNARLNAPGRNWMIVRFNADGSILSHTIYDVYGGTGATPFTSALNALAYGTPVAIYTYDEPLGGMTPAMRTAMVDCGGTVDGIAAIGFRSGYILLGSKGIGEAGGIEKVSKTFDTATSWVELQFQLFNGRPNLPGATGVANKATATAGALSTLSTAVGVHDGQIAAQALAQSDLSAVVGTNTANISSVTTAQATTAGKVNASYTFSMTAGANGAKLVSGVTFQNDGVTSDAVFLFNRFAVGRITDTGGFKYPFVVGTVAGADTVGIDGNLAVDGTIQARSLNVGSGRNLLANTAFASGLDYWNVYGTLGTVNYGMNLGGAYWNPAGILAAGIMQGNGDYAGHSMYDRYAEIQSNPVPVEANKRYEFSVYTGAHRCITYCVVVFMDAAGNSIDASNINTTTNNAESLGGPQLSTWKRIFTFARAPVNAASVKVLMRKSATLLGNTDSYAFFAAPLLAEATENQSVLSAWAPAGLGVQITPSGISTPTLSALSVNLGTSTTGRFDIASGSQGEGWGYVRSNGKWYRDGQNGFLFGRNIDGTSMANIEAGVCKLWMHSTGDAGWQSPGILMTNGGLTIDQVNVIGTLQIKGRAVTLPLGAEATNRINMADTTTEYGHLYFYGADFGGDLVTVSVQAFATRFLSGSDPDEPASQVPLTVNTRIRRNGAIIKDMGQTSLAVFAVPAGAADYSISFLSPINAGNTFLRARTAVMLGCKR